MIEFDGAEYEINHAKWNGPVQAYLVDGKYTYIRPVGKVYVGYITTPRGLLEVWRSKYPVKYIVVAVLFVVACLVSNHIQPDVQYYRASFAEAPVYRDGTLYCTVVNVADREVTVQFLGAGGEQSALTLLRPGDTIPTIELDFIPTVIQYDQKYSFELEVQYDGF